MAAIVPRFKSIHTRIPGSKYREGTKRALSFFSFLFFFITENLTQNLSSLHPQTLKRLSVPFCQNWIICPSQNKSLIKENWIVIISLRERSSKIPPGDFWQYLERFLVVRTSNQNQGSIGKNEGENGS